jgi:hypothetical protein
MSVERTHIGHETRYTVRDGTALRCVLVFDAGEDGGGPAAWKILLPGPHQAEEQLYGTHRAGGPDRGDLKAWLTPIAGAGAAAELATAVEADPPQAAAWLRPPDR